MMIGDLVATQLPLVAMGARLGRYVMLKHLASGGMADVVLGRSDGIEGFERHVVLKRIRPELARDQRFVRMFLDEARVAATLHHQHIVQVHDIGEAAGEFFIAMEYVHGEDVRKILSAAARQRTHVPLGYAVAIVSAAAAGLHYAHERCGSDKQPLNIVHRDVSPSNILVGYDGSIKVVDFGIATASMRQETRSGSLKGKLSYMSPEQCKGMVVDRRSDVYALGVVLYELATTTRMIKGDSDYLVMEQIVTGRISPPQLRRPGLPSELSEIIMRALTADRERRYASADELRLALDQFASNAGLTASTSAIAAYMRKQFGERPEPWLDITGQSPALDDVPTSIEESIPSNSWTELPRIDGDPRRSTSSIPRQSGPLGVISGDPGSDAASRMTVPQRPSITPIPTGQPRTDSRMGWESQPPVAAASALRNFPVRKAAVAAGALVGAVAIWLIASMVSSAPAPVAPPIIVQAAPTPPAPMPSMPQPPPEPEVVATAPAAAPEIEDRDSSPTRKARAAAAVAATRPAVKTPVETAPPPAPKPDRPVRATEPTPPPPAKDRPTRLAATSSSPTSTRSETGTVEPELHRTPVTPTPPPTPEIVPPPAPAAELPPPAPAPTPPQVVAPTALDANRIAGDKSIIPDPTTMAAIGRSGQTTLISSYKVCVTAEGNVNAVTLLRSTGFPAYDTKIQNTIRKDWRYKPFLVSGKATPVCTALRFIYSQK
jgi:eukaryotic-like serine/threonine-protein kinase